MFNVMMNPVDFLDGVSRVLDSARSKRKKKLEANPQADVAELDFEISNLQDGYDYVLENIEIWRQEISDAYRTPLPVVIKNRQWHESSLFDLSSHPD